MTKRRKFSDQFRAWLALEALRGDRTIQEITDTPDPGQHLEKAGR